VTIALAGGGLEKSPNRFRQVRVVEVLRSAIASASRSVTSNPANLAKAAAWRPLISALDVATLAAALAAIGHPVPLLDAFIALVLASATRASPFSTHRSLARIVQGDPQ